MCPCAVDAAQQNSLQQHQSQRSSHLEVAAGAHTQGRTQHCDQRVTLVQRQVDGPACTMDRQGTAYQPTALAADRAGSAAAHLHSAAGQPFHPKQSHKGLTSRLIHRQRHVSQLLRTFRCAALQRRARLVHCLEARREPQAAGRVVG